MEEYSQPAQAGDGKSCKPCFDDACQNSCQAGPQSAVPGVKGKLRQIFGHCANCAGSGLGGAFLSHSGCALALVIGGASGAALSARMMSLMVVTSPVIAAGVTAAIDYVRHRRVSVPRVVTSAALGSLMALGVHHYQMSHGDMKGMHHMHRMPDGSMMDNRDMELRPKQKGTPAVPATQP